MLYIHFYRAGPVVAIEKPRNAYFNAPHSFLNNVTV